MIEIGNFGCGFEHSTSSTLYKPIENFKWIYNQTRDTTFWCDNAIERGVNANCKNKVAWLVESRAIVPEAIDFIKNNVELVSKSYKYLFSHYQEICDLADNFVFMPSHGTWILEPKVYKKTKLASIICSNKNWVNGHKFRLEWVEKLKGKVDLYGRGFNEISKKEDGLIDYAFSFVFENDQYPFYFSEKLLDNFSTATVPIYWGSPGIDRFFNMDGIILLDENFSLDKLSFDAYNERMPAILDNLERVRQYSVIEDIIWEKYLKDDSSFK